jgi:hypothetical protein
VAGHTAARRASGGGVECPLAATQGRVPFVFVRDAVGQPRQPEAHNGATGDAASQEADGLGGLGLGVAQRTAEK